MLGSGLPPEYEFGPLNSKQVLHNTLQHNVLRLNKVVDWLCNHLEYLLYRHFDDAAKSLLAKEFSVLMSHDKFLVRMPTAFRALVANRTVSLRFEP